MGYGDDLMITGFARIEKKKYPNKQVVIGNLDEKKIYHSIIYDNNPNITYVKDLDRKKSVHFINYHNFNRPYINYEKSNLERWFWNMDFSPTPGELYFSEHEKKIADEIIIEAKQFWKKKNKSNYNAIIFLEASSTKIHSSALSLKQKNINWGFNNWNQLATKINNDYLIIQSVHETSKKIEGAFYSNKKFNFRIACAILERSDLFVGPQGGFVHAAAALNKKAVVYYGGWIHPRITGYNFHENLYFVHPKSPCGARGYLCDHCEEARKSIKVDFFEDKIRMVVLKN